MHHRSPSLGGSTVRSRRLLRRGEMRCSAARRSEIRQLSGSRESDVRRDLLRLASLRFGPSESICWKQGTLAGRSTPLRAFRIVSADSVESIDRPLHLSSFATTLGDCGRTGRIASGSRSAAARVILLRGREIVMSATLAVTTPSDEALAAVVAEQRSAANMSAAEHAFSTLYARHSQLLRGFLASRVRNRSQLDDLDQNIWIKVWKSLPEQFSGGNFRGWLHQIARNELIDNARKKKHDSLPDEFQPEDARQASPDAAVIDGERKQTLEGCMKKLSAEQALIVRARLEGEDYDSICERLGITAAKGQKQFHLAKKQLQDCVERSEP